MYPKNQIIAGDNNCLSNRRYIVYTLLSILSIAGKAEKREMLRAAKEVACTQTTMWGGQSIGAE